MSRNVVKKASQRCVSIGGVKLHAGEYLASNASEAVRKRPGKKTGYAYFDGETLLLRNYSYAGTGENVGIFQVGVDLSGATTEVIFKGNNTIEITGAEKTAALLVNDGKVTICGKGKLTLRAGGGAQANFALLGSGAVVIKSGTVCLEAQVGAFTIGSDGQRIFSSDSYAVKVGKLDAKRARVRGDDREESHRGKDAALNEINRNNESEVVIDVLRGLFWWWGKGSLVQLLLLLVAVAAIGVTAWTLSERDTQILEPDFPLLDIEPNAQRVEEEIQQPEETEKKPSTGGGSVILNFSYDVLVDLSEGEAQLYFGLPGRSNKDAVLQLIVDDLLLAQSGRLPPGYHVNELVVEEYAIQRLQTGQYEGKLRILYYDDETGERAILDTEIEVDVTVIE